MSRAYYDAYFDRWDVCAAYNMYAVLWNSTNAYIQGIQGRLSALEYWSPSEQTFEGMSANARLIYGMLERRHHRHWVAYQRLRRRHPDVVPSWPGRMNNPELTEANWLRGNGIDPAALDMVCP